MTHREVETSARSVYHLSTATDRETMDRMIIISDHQWAEFKQRFPGLAVSYIASCLQRNASMVILTEGKSTRLQALS